MEVIFAPCKNLAGSCHKAMEDCGAAVAGAVAVHVCESFAIIAGRGQRLDLSRPLAKSALGLVGARPKCVVLGRIWPKIGLQPALKALPPPCAMSGGHPTLHKI